MPANIVIGRGRKSNPHGAIMDYEWDFPSQQARSSRRGMHPTLGRSRNILQLRDENPAMVTPLMENAGGRVRRVFADGAYDGQPTYNEIRDASPPKSKPKIVINPRNTSIPDNASAYGGSERERHTSRIAEVGQMTLQKETDHGLRSLGETAIGRIKSKPGGSVGQKPVFMNILG